MSNGVNSMIGETYLREIGEDGADDQDESHNDGSDWWDGARTWTPRVLQGGRRLVLQWLHVKF